MASNLGNLAATVSLNIDPFEKSSRVLSREMKTIDTALKNNELAFKNNSKNISAQKSSYVLTGKAIEVHNAQLNKQKLHYEKLKSSIGDVNKATAEQKVDLLSAEAAISNTEAKISQLTSSYASLGKQIAVQSSNWTKVGTTLEMTGTKISSAGEALDKFGNKMTLGVTAPLVAGVGIVTKAAMEWESAFAGVKKTNDEVVDANGKVVYSYKDLETGLRDLAKELPASHKEIASVAEAAGQLGIQTENVVGFTKTMIDLGESTNLSAEEAATALAKIANITGMTSDEYERFGSSVVALGNNFATSESEIIALSNRLAAAGTLAGLSETEILGLATAMSSVGIEAEAGGTAMTQTLTAIESAVASGGESLDKFAKVSNLTTEKFATTWKDKPIEAIQAFIKGLGELDGKGESATLMLDEMGLSGIRQANMLKSLALASETMGSAVEMSGKAWKENTALSEEAGKRYATVDSQLDILKNNINEVAITAGGPLLEALNAAIQSAKPFIETISNLAKKFSEMDESSQRSIMKMIGFAAAIGPVSKALGGFFKVAGGGISTLGKFSQTLGKINGISKLSRVSLSAIGTEATLLGTASTTGATGLTGIVAGLSAIAGPATLAVGGIGLVVGAIYAGAKAYEDYQLSGEKWGTSVTKEQDKILDKTYQLSREAVDSINAYADGVRGAADKTVEANQSIVNSIQEAIDKEYERNKKNAEKVDNKDIQRRLNQQNEAEKRVNDAKVKSAKETADRINKIMTSASEENRNLSNEERAYIEANYKQLTAAQLEATGLSKEKIIAIESAYQTKLTELSKKELANRVNTVRGALDSEKSAYEEQREAIISGTKNNTNLQKELLKELDTEHHNTMESMILGYARLIEAQGGSIEDSAALWEVYGFTTQEVANLINQNAESAYKDLSLFAQGANEADNTWNEMSLDTKTGEVKTNMVDALKEMAETEDGWDKLKFMVKNADISSNAKNEVALAMGEAGKWNDLYPTEKLLLVDNNQALANFYDSVDANNQWNEATPLIKELGVQNIDAITKILSSKETLQSWNNMPSDLKDILVNDGDKSKITTSQDMWNAWNALPDSLKNITIQADTSGATIAQSAINNVQDRTVWINVAVNDMATKTLANKGVAGLRATGDPYFQGGKVWLGDGGKSEPYLTPQGDFGISPNDWTLYDLPRGTKIWPSVQKMMETLPKYAHGTKFDDTDISRFKFNPIVNSVNNIDNSKLDSIISLLGKLLGKENNYVFEGIVQLDNAREVGRWLTPAIQKENQNNERRLKRNRGDG